MSDKLIIPYNECVELAQLKYKKQEKGYNSFTKDEKIKWENFRAKEKYADEVGRSWFEEDTGVTVWTRPSFGYLVKKFFGLKTKDDIRWM